MPDVIHVLTNLPTVRNPILSNLSFFDTCSFTQAFNITLSEAESRRYRNWLDDLFVEDRLQEYLRAGHRMTLVRDDLRRLEKMRCTGVDPRPGKPMLLAFHCLATYQGYLPHFPRGLDESNNPIDITQPLDSFDASTDHIFDMSLLPLAAKVLKGTDHVNDTGGQEPSYLDQMRDVKSLECGRWRRCSTLSTISST